MVKKLIFLFLFPIMAFGTTFSLFYSQNILSLDDMKLFSNTFQPKISYESTNFSFDVSLLFSNDGKFPPFMQDFYGNYYIILTDAGIRFSVENLRFSLGNLSNYDIVGSPYSLYFSSLGHSKPTISIKYLDDKFEYETRYVLISYSNGLNFVDKGMNFKYYSIKFGNFRFGYEESIVYASRTNFDLDYFLNPIPNFFIQYARKRFYENSAIFDDNSLMGFFADYNDSEKYIYAQILIDDFNANRVFNPDNPTVDKIAWSIGGRKEIGKDLSLGVYHAGATKYTFQPSKESGNPLYYGYTYYTEIIFDNYIIDYQDNYIGYKYGENNIAFLLDIIWTPQNYKVHSSLEFLISGSKSPVNPWGEEETYEPGFNLLNEGVLEKTILFKNSIEKNFGKITLGANITTGVILNKLEVVDSEDSAGKPYFLPSENNEKIFDLAFYLEFKYNFWANFVWIVTKNSWKFTNAC